MSDRPDNAPRASSTGKSYANMPPKKATTDPEEIRRRRGIEGGECLDFIGRKSPSFRANATSKNSGGYDGDKTTSAGKRSPAKTPKGNRG